MSGRDRAERGRQRMTWEETPVDLWWDKAVKFPEWDGDDARMWAKSYAKWLLMTVPGRVFCCLMTVLFTTLCWVLPGGWLYAGGGEGAQEALSSSDGACVESADMEAADVAEWAGEPFVEVDGGVPAFDAEDLGLDGERYSELDYLGRCGVAIAVVGPETMPDAERGSIAGVEPSGWRTVRYDDLIEDRYLYNRCHLIGYQLTGRNADARNLITGTRYLNVEGMLPFEDEVADYVEQTGGRVLYRVEPVFSGEELVARGVHMEALSLDDDGASVSFNVFCYNVQPGVEIDYATGDSRRAGADADGKARAYVVNVASGKFHLPACAFVESMSPANRRDVTATRAQLVESGFEPCGACGP